MAMLRGLLNLALTVAFLGSAVPQSLAVLADAGHRPFNADVPQADGSPTPRRQFREPYVEISNNPASPTTVTIYEGIYKGTGTEATWTDNDSQTGISPANVTTRFYKVVVRLRQP
jgi:hypothetical protein